MTKSDENNDTVSELVTIVTTEKFIIISSLLSFFNLICVYSKLKHLDLKNQCNFSN